MVAGEGQSTMSRPSSSSRREPSSSADAYAPLPRLKRLLSIRSRQARSSPDQREGEGSRKDVGGSSDQRRAEEMESEARVYSDQKANASPRQAADDFANPEASTSRAAQAQTTADLAADPLASTQSEHSILFYHQREGMPSGALDDDKALPSLPEEQSRTMLRKFSLRRWVGKKTENTPPSSSRDSQYHYQRRRSQSQPHLDLVPPASTPPLEPPRRPSLPSNNSAPAPVVPRKPVPRLDERASREEPRGLGLTLGKPSSLVSSQGQRAVGSSDPNSSMSSGQRASSGGAPPRFSLSGSSQHDVMRITTADSDAEGEGGAGGSTSGLMWLQRPGGPRPQPLQPVVQRASVQRSPNFAPAPLSSLRAQMVSPAPTSLGPRASVLSTEGEAGFSSALEAEIGTARKVVGHGRAQEQSILRLVEDNSQDVQREQQEEEEEAVAPAAAALDDAIKELRAVEQPVDGGEAPRSFVVQARAGGDDSMTSESDADAENRNQAAATLPRPHTRPRSSSVSSAEDGKQARSPGPPPPSAPSSSFFTSLGRSHKRSKSSGVLSSGVPASSVGAASGSMTPRRQQEKDRRERKREREKEKQRVKRYAEMKTRDPLLVERLALMGLKHQPGAGQQASEGRQSQSDAADALASQAGGDAAAAADGVAGEEGGPRAGSPSVSPSASIHTAKSRFASTSRPNTAGSSYAPARAHADLVSTPSADIISPATGASESLLRARRASLDEAAREVLARKTSVKASASQPPLLVRKVSSGTPRQAPKHLSMEAAIEDLPPPTTPTR